MKDLPVIEPKEIITTITNMKTGEVYKDDSEWKAKGIAESDIRKDVRVIMPSLDLFGETKQNRPMAITNAQQYQQLVNPPMKGKKRPGYRGSDYGDQAKGTGAYSGGPPGNTGGGSTDRSRTTDRQDYNTAIATGQNPLGLNLDKGPPDLTSKEKKFVKDNASFFQKLKNKNIQSFLDRNKYLALQKSGLIPTTGFKGLGLAIFDGLTGKVPENLQDLSEDELNSLALEINKMKAGGQNVMTNKMMEGKDILSRTLEGQNLLDNDLMTQSKFEELFPGPNIPKDGDGPSDPCKGPNPPAYCFTGIRSAAPEVEEDDDEIINYRLMSKGGRAAFGGGSDMGSVADSQGNVGPGTGGYQGGPQGGMGQGFGGGDRPEGPPTTGGGDGPKFDIFNPIDSIKAKIANFAGLKLEDIARAKSLEDDENEKSLQETLAGGITNMDKVMNRQKEIEAKAKELGFATGGRIGLMEGGMPYEGGIMDLESARQMYGLGKLVKKITRGVKKVAKSPIGKAAIGAALFKFGGGSGVMKSLFGVKARNQALLGKEGFLGSLGLTKGFGSYMPTALGGIAASTLGSYFLTPKEEDDDEELYAGADIDDPRFIMANASKYTNPRLMAEGGSTEEPVAKKVMPLLDMDGKEKDYRETGGFVDMGRMEKADDVPARLSKNEFVFTADAVRNAGDGSVDKGAEVMYNMMKNLESGGDVSEDSQGLDGARKMFQTSQRLEEVL